jgi:hypothetical protein
MCDIALAIIIIDETNNQSSLGIPHAALATLNYGHNMFTNIHATIIILKV